MNMTRIRKFATILGLATMPVLSQAQNVSLEWAKGFGGTTANEYGTNIAMDDDNNVYLAGYISDTTDMDPSAAVYNLTAAQNSNGFVNTTIIAKYNSTGALVWAKALNGTTGSNYANAISLDQTGHLVISGYCTDSVKFGTTTNSILVSNAALNGYVAKYDTAGNFVWVRGIRGVDPTHSTYITSSTISPDGSIYVTGSHTDTLKFTESTITLPPTGNVYWKAFLVKYNATGLVQWAKHFGSTGEYPYAYSEGSVVQADSLNNVYVAGRFRYKIDLDPGSDSTIVYNDNQSAFFSKFDASGNFKWGKAIVGTGNGTATRIRMDKYNGHFYLSGHVTGTLDFNPGIGVYNLTAASTSISDAYFAKYDTAGNFSWANILTGLRNKAIGDLRPSRTSDHIYLLGHYNLKVDFDPGPDTAFLYTSGNFVPNIYIAKYDTAGAYEWATNLSSSDQNVSGGDVGVALTVDNVGGLFAMGTFKGQTDFDPGTGSNVLTSNTGSKDLFLAKFTDGCIAYTHLNESACDSFTYNGTTYLTSGSYQHIYNRIGSCDSVVTLNLTLNYSSIAPTVVGTFCDSATFNGHTYYTTGIYTQTISNISGCDSILTFDIEIKGTTQQTTLDETACGDYTYNGNTYTNSGTYVVVYQSAVGCDSIVTLNLTIEPSITASLIQNSNTLIANGGDSYQWINCADNSLIVGATAQQYTATVDGSYAAIVAAGSCSDTSDCIELTGLSLQGKLGNTNQVIVYPNPTKDNATLLATQALENASIKLINPFGQIVRVLNQQKGKQFNIDLSSLASGVYLIEITDGKNKTNLKIVKQ